MKENPTAQIIWSILSDKINSPILVFTQRKKYEGILKHVNDAGDLILKVEDKKIFCKRTGLISFEINWDEK